VVSIYKLPDINYSCKQWRDLFDGLLQISTSPYVIVLGDFNAQNEAWGSSRNNGSGLSFNKFLSTSPFFFLNNGHRTRISATADYNSVPDISITNHTNIKFDWSLGDDPMGSDHMPIMIHLFDNLTISSRISMFSDINSQKRPKLCLRNFDKDLFTTLIQEKINFLPSAQVSDDPF